MRSRADPPADAAATLGAGPPAAADTGVGAVAGNGGALAGKGGALADNGCAAAGSGGAVGRGGGMIARGAGLKPGGGAAGTWEYRRRRCRRK